MVGGGPRDDVNTADVFVNTADVSHGAVRRPSTAFLLSGTSAVSVAILAGGSLPPDRKRCCPGEP